MADKKRPQRASHDQPSRLFSENPELATVVTAKRMGLSFDELNMLTMGDYLDFVDMWLGDEEGEAREGTQADIKSFFG